MEHKFKKGDIVRGNNYGDRIYCIANARMTKGEVVYVYKNGNIDVRIIEHSDWCYLGHMIRNANSECFDLVERPANSKVKFPEMHIYTDGKTTTAVYKHDGIKETAKAVCSPDDEFDFLIGAKLAVERLGVKPKLLNTKFVCLTNGIQGLTRGKIYEVKDGHFIDDDLFKYPQSSPLRDIDDLKVYFSWDGYYRQCRGSTFCKATVDFVEVVE